MGFWDIGIGDLQGLGVNVSAAQRFALHEEGEVLVVQHLLSIAASDGDNSGTYDQEGQPVFIPQLMTTFPPESTGRELEEWYGSQWRSWPSYTGYLDESSVDQRWWNDNTTYMRVWEGTPLLNTNEKDVYNRIVSAAQERINRSVYQELCAVYDFESSGEYGYGLEELLPIVDLLAEHDDPDISGVLEFGEHDDPCYLLYIARIMKELLEENYLSFTNYTVRSNHPGQPRKDLTFEPMSTYLRDDDEATAMWNRLVNRRENALAVITNGLSPARGMMFDNVERST